MPNWARAARQQFAHLEVTKRSRYAIHFRKGNRNLAVFSGYPCHYLDAQQEWQEIDTDLELDLVAGKYRGKGTPVSIGVDGGVTLDGTDYRQHTTHVGVYRPSTQKLVWSRALPAADAPRGNRLIRETQTYVHEIRLSEVGVKETLTIKRRPVIPGVRAGDYLVLRTEIEGVDLDEGETGDFRALDHQFPQIHAEDAKGNQAPVRRVVRREGDTLVLYSGIPVVWLARAVYPITIDPTFAGSTADGMIQGYDNSGDYNAARSTSNFKDITSDNSGVGQLYLAEGAGRYWCFRTFLKFDTSAIGVGGVISQVNLRMAIQNELSTTDFNVQIMKQDWSGQDPITDGNREAAYDACLAGALDDNIWRNTAGAVVDTQYTSGNLDTSWVSKTGNTYYSLLSSRDDAGNAPTGNERIYVYTAEAAEADHRPALLVEYTATYSQSVAGAMTFTGTVFKKTELLKVGAISFTGTSARTMKFARSVLSGALTFVGAVTKRSPRVFAGTLTPTGTVTKRAFVLSVGSLTLSGQSVRKAMKVLGGTFTPTGVSLRTMAFARTIFAGVFTSSGALVRRTEKVLTGTLTSSGVLAKLVRKGAFTGNLTPTGTVTKRSGRVFVGAMTWIGVTSKKMLLARTVVSGTLTPAGAVTKKMTLARTVLTGTLTFVGTVKRKTLKIVTGGLTFIGEITRDTMKHLAGVLTPVGAVFKMTPKLLTGFIPFEGTSSRTMMFARTVFSGVISFIGAVTSERPEKVGFITITETLLYTITISELGDES